MGRFTIGQRVRYTAERDVAPINRRHLEFGMAEVFTSRGSRIVNIADLIAA